MSMTHVPYVTDGESFRVDPDEQYQVLKEYQDDPTDRARIKVRRSHKTQSVTDLNPILDEGQPFYDMEAKVLKIGDGTTAYNDLPAVTYGVELILNQHISESTSRLDNLEKLPILQGSMSYTSGSNSYVVTTSTQITQSLPVLLVLTNTAQSGNSASPTMSFDPFGLSSVPIYNITGETLPASSITANRPYVFLITTGAAYLLSSVNATSLNGCTVNDNAPAATNILWSSQKINNTFNDLYDKVAAASLFYVQATQPSNTRALWVNTTDSVLYYYNPSTRRWTPSLGTYA